MILIPAGRRCSVSWPASLHDDGADLTTSLAGRVANPRLPVGEVRIGGFGGPQPPARWLEEHGVIAVVDATHPFAERIRVCGESVRGGRRPARGSSGRVERARRGIAGTGSTTCTRRPHASGPCTRVLLTTGRQASPLAHVHDACSSSAASTRLTRRCRRSTRSSSTGAPTRVLKAELALIDRHRIDLVVTKDSGGTYTIASSTQPASAAFPVGRGPPPAPSSSPRRRDRARSARLGPAGSTRIAPRRVETRGGPAP